MLRNNPGNNLKDTYVNQIQTWIQNIRHKTLHDIKIFDTCSQFTSDIIPKKKVVLKPLKQKFNQISRIQYTTPNTDQYQSLLNRSIFIEKKQTPDKRNTEIVRKFNDQVKIQNQNKFVKQQQQKSSSTDKRPNRLQLKKYSICEWSVYSSDDCLE